MCKIAEMEKDTIANKQKKAKHIFFNKKKGKAKHILIFYLKRQSQSQTLIERLGI